MARELPDPPGAQPRAADGPASGDWPNLFVVGAPKAGTTSLWRYLGQHPDIFMSPVKEPGFFSRDWFPAKASDPRSYLRLFAGARRGQLRGEASPMYLADDAAPAAIKRVSPQARIVISLREPVALGHAVYLHMARIGVEPRSFRQALTDEIVDQRLSRDRPPYVRSALFASPVRRYMETFPSRVFVLFFEELLADTRGVVRRLYEFLGVDPAFADRFDPRPHNQFAVPRHRALGRLLDSRRLVAGARAVVPLGVRDRITDVLARPADPPAPDPESVRLLREACGPDVVALAALLGRRLPAAWEQRFPRSTPSPHANSSGRNTVASRHT